MKAKLTEGMFTSRTDEWTTPQAIFEALDKEFHFDSDAAATPENAKCKNFFTKDDLMPDWSKFKSIFLNPPYSQNPEFMKKAYETGTYGSSTVVVLSPCRTDTRWWHNYAMQASEIWFIKGRVKYGGGKQSPPFPSCIIIFKNILDRDPCGMRIKSVNAFDLS
jgi:site-specific DNA-methyltransferase (adenine-specific)